jgi:hypothetical protein
MVGCNWRPLLDSRQRYQPQLAMAPVPSRRRRAAEAAITNLALLLAASGTLAPGVASAQQSGYGQTLGITPQERQLYGSGSSGGPGGGQIDPRNPIDLINQLRRSTALDDATPPATAVDQALKALESPPAPARPTAPTAGPKPAGP